MTVIILSFELAKFFLIYFVVRRMFFPTKQSPSLCGTLRVLRHHTCPGGRCQGSTRAVARNDETVYYKLKSCFASVQTIASAIPPPTIMPISAVTIAPPGKYNATA